MSDSSDLHKTCKTCVYARTYTLVNPAIGHLVEKYPHLLKKSYDITKCHLQGKPEVVDINEDWCYQYECDVNKIEST